MALHVIEKLAVNKEILFYKNIEFRNILILKQKRRKKKINILNKEESRIYVFISPKKIDEILII